MPRQIVSPEIKKLLVREMRKQKMKLSRASRKELLQIAALCKIIEEQGLPKYLICKKLDKKLGYGIFLRSDAEPILKGQVIAPYSGEVSIIAQNAPDEGLYAFTPLEDMRLTKQEQARFDKKRRFHPSRLYSFKVDALKKGNFARYINHSEKPNIVAYGLTIPSNRYGVESMPAEIVYFAKKTIYPGEQLMVNYEDGGKSYWGAKKPLLMTPTTFRV